MSNFQVFASPKLEILLDELSSQFKTKTPFSPENLFSSNTIIVQNAKLRRWLQLGLARKFNGVMNLNVPFLTRFIVDSVLRPTGSITPKNSLEDELTPEALTWQIYEELPILSEKSELIASYLNLNSLNESPESQQRKFHLAHQIAQVFSDYLQFRFPQIILPWKANKSDRISLPQDSWQKDLFNQLKARKTSNIPSTIPEGIAQFLEKVKTNQANLREQLHHLPETIYLFGMGQMIPLYLDFFVALSEFRKIELFAFSPTSEYWECQKNDKIQSRQLVEEYLAKLELEKELKSFSVGLPSCKIDDPLPFLTDEFLAQENENLASSSLNLGAHPLLASWGLGSAEFLAQLLEKDIFPDFIPPKSPQNSSVLSRLQQQIYLNSSPGSEVELSEPGALSPNLDDTSIRISNCYLPVREVEALRDFLLSEIENGRLTDPNQILVLTPKLDEYSPIIQDVFSRSDIKFPSDESRKSPLIVSVSNRENFDQHNTFHALIETLKLQRFEVESVLEILKTPLIYEHYGLSENELPTIANLWENANIRWGWDAQHRKELGFSEFGDFSWKEGLTRLLDGYAQGSTIPNAIPQNDEFDYRPISNVSQSITIATFEFLSDLRHHTQIFATPTNSQNWILRLKNFISTFFDPSKETEQLSELFYAIKSLEKTFSTAKLSPETLISAEVIACALENSLTASDDSIGFIRGPITVSDLMPRKMVPADYICLLGMNEGDFPRTKIPVSFDLISRKHILGDTREQMMDSNLFLEVVMNTRKSLWISFLGKDAVSGVDLPPSKVVAELLDHLIYCGISEEFSKEELTKFWLRDVPLHAFSEKNFSTQLNASGTFSLLAETAQNLYSQEKNQTLQKRENAFSWPEFLDNTLTLKPSDFRSMFRAPVAQFLFHQTGIKFQDFINDEPSSFEPIHASDSDINKFAIQRAIFQDFLPNGIPDPSEQLAKQLKWENPKLPRGGFGQHVIEKTIDRELEDISALTEILGTPCHWDTWKYIKNFPIPHPKEQTQQITLEISFPIPKQNSNATYSWDIASASSFETEPKFYPALLDNLVPALGILASGASSLHILATAKKNFLVFDLTQIEAQKLLDEIILFYLKGISNPYFWGKSAMKNWLENKETKTLISQFDASPTPESFAEQNLANLAEIGNLGWEQSSSFGNNSPDNTKPENILFFGKNSSLTNILVNSSIFQDLSQIYQFIQNSKVRRLTSRDIKKQFPK